MINSDSGSSAAATPRTYHFEQFVVDLGRQQLLGADGTPIVLTQRAFDVLLCLIENRPRVVRKDDLIRAAWPHGFVEENNLNQAISALRQVFGDRRESPRFIATVSSRGYRFVADVRVDVKAPEPVAASEPSVAGADAAVVRGRRKVLGLAALAVVIGAATIVVLHQSGVQTAAVSDAPVHLVAPVRAEKTIAVLPFVNTSSDPEYENFADGMTDEILNLLSGVQGLRVTSRTSSFSFKGKQVDLPTLARQLGVSYVVEGTVRKNGNRVRVTAQLIDVADDAYLWSEIYERQQDDVFAIQANVSGQIAKVLKIAMNADELNSIGKPPTANLEAWQQYLRASLLFRNRTRISDLEDAIRLVDAAIVRDPQFARAHALRAMLSMTLNEYVDSARHEDYWRQALAAADRALEVDPTLGEPYLVRALNLRANSRWSEANNAFKEAVARAPGNAYGRMQYGQFLISIGYLDHGWAELQRAGELDPLSPVIFWQVALGALATGRFDEVNQFAARSRENGWVDWQPDAVMGGAAMLKGELDLAEPLFIKAIPRRKAQIEQSMAALRKKHIDAPTRAMLDGLLPFGPPGMGRWSVEAYLGDVDAAIVTLHAYVDQDSLIKADGTGGPVRARSGGIDSPGVILPDVWSITGASVRRDPRFVEFVRSIGLLDFWRENGWPDRCRPVGDAVHCD